MKRLEFIRRQPWITDYNLLVETINKLIDEQEKKIEVEPVVIDRKIKDFGFFNNEEMPLPYEAHYTINTANDASAVFNKYVLSFDEMKVINKALDKWKIVSLSIFVNELVTEKEEKQEAIFETVTTEVVEPKEEEVYVEVVKPKEEVEEVKQPKKRGRKKKTRK